MPQREAQSGRERGLSAGAHLRVFLGTSNNIYGNYIPNYPKEWQAVSMVQAKFGIQLEINGDSEETA